VEKEGEGINVEDDGPLWGCFAFQSLPLIFLLWLLLLPNVHDHNKIRRHQTCTL